MFQCAPPWVYPVWTLCTFWTWVIISLTMLGKFYYYNLFGCFLRPFLIPLLLLYFLDSYNVNFDVFNVVPDVSETVFISFPFFPLCCSASVICSALLLLCSLPVHLNFLLPQLLCYWFPLVCFYFSYCIVHC